MSSDKHFNRKFDPLVQKIFEDAIARVRFFLRSFKEGICCFSDVKLDQTMRKVAIIIPVYNTSCYLEECLASILIERKIPLRVYAVDDGSTDNSRSILKEWANKDRRVRVIYQKNQGVSAARNAALDAIEDDGSFDYVWFFDSDDIAAPGILATMYNSLENSNADVCICGFLPFDRLGASSCSLAREETRVVNRAELAEHFFASDYVGGSALRLNGEVCKTNFCALDC